MVLHCTQKLLKDIGITKRSLAEISTNNTILGNWYANLLTISRCKTVLFTNEKTFTSFIGIGIKKSKPQTLEEAFLNGLESLLFLQGVDDDVIDTIMSEYTEIQFAKTNSRSVLGTMNEQAFVYDMLINEGGGLKMCDMMGITQHINHMLMRAPDYIYPDEVLQEVVQKHVIESKK